MRNWLKTLLFLSTFSPSLMSIGLSRIWSQGFAVEDSFYILSGAAGFSLGAIIIRSAEKHSETINFSAKKIEANDALMLGVFGTYIIPFLGVASNITFTTVVLIILVFAALLWLVSSILPHPMLRILGYKFYKVESATGVVYTLLARRELLDPKNIKQVKKISNSMLVEVT
ncbi:hypothetical protein [Methylobacterium sp. SyP6R]|uniref:hypothetical protein n=1 Tax=Methylobacterium sp. SyP6R TaxID=2718876 RepID=UPI001F3319BE|nr:hypothetical protein [Methylobacterium sp. SyP6R]MCF4123937.1 hypothetical protein [Methylobacterium sp. SyP6R]